MVWRLSQSTTWVGPFQPNPEPLNSAGPPEYQIGLGQISPNKILNFNPKLELRGI